MIYTYECVALVLAAFLFAVNYRKQKSDVKIYHLIHSLTISVFSLAAVDILQKTLEQYKGIVGIFPIYTTTILYFVILSAICVQLVKYFVLRINIRLLQKKFFQCMVYIPFIILTILYITTPWTGWLFSYDEEGIFIKGAFFSSFYVKVLYYFVIAFIAFGIYRDKKRTLLFGHLCYISLSGVILCVLYEYMQERYVFTYGVALLLLVIFLSMKNTTEVYDSTNAIYGHYLMDTLWEELGNHKKSALFFIKIHDYDLLEDSFGDEEINVIMRKATAFLFDIHKGSFVYHIENNLYVVLLKNYEEGDEKEVKEKIISRFRKEWKKGRTTVVFPVGMLSLYLPQDMEQEEELPELLDRVFRIEIPVDADWTKENLIAEKDEKEVLRAIKEAVEKDSFMVYYQPIYSAKKKRIVAAEALVRLFDDKLGFISPEKFIPLAEREGYILKVGKFVFKEVCRFYSEENLSSKGIEYIEVNLSAVQCMQYKLAEEFIDIMKEYHILPEQMNFEITESSALASNSVVSLNINSFVNYGIDLSLDDYGTGYSNISYLYRLPFQYIKIDKSILWSADKNEKANATLRNIFSMAKKLNLKIVMEGVETEEHVRKLLKLKCDYFQGYYFSKPVNEKKFLDYVEEFELPKVCSE